MNQTNPTTSRLILVRHGETNWNRLHRFQGRSDIPLNEMGRRQAQALAKALKDEDLTAIYTSPLQRAVDTACYIGSFHPTSSIIREPDLIEMDLGGFEGMEGRRWASAYPDFKARWEQSPAELSMPGGESLQNVQLRVVPVMKRLLQGVQPGSTILLSSHNFVIVTLLCFVSNLPLDRFRDMRQDTAALNIVEFDGDNWWASSVNDCRHLIDLH